VGQRGKEVIKGRATRGALPISPFPLVESEGGNAARVEKFGGVPPEESGCNPLAGEIREAKPTLEIMYNHSSRGEADQKMKASRIRRDKTANLEKPPSQTAKERADK